MPGQRPTIPPISYKDINDTAYITQDTFMEGVSHISANDVIAPKDPIYGRYVPTAPLINSSNIFWNNAYLPTSGAYVNSTYELLWNIDQAMQHGSGGGGGGSTPIDPSIVTPDLISAMINSIRALQAEVLRLRNSFICGIESYQETATHMSTVINQQYSDVLEEEPLWATDETELSWIEDANTELTQGSTAFQKDGTGSGEMHIDDNADVGRITFSGDAEFSWVCPNDSTLISVDDAKIYMYLTLNNLNGRVTITTETQEDIALNFHDLQGVPSTSKYNVMIIISRAVKDKNGAFHGNRFIWVSINDYYKDNIETYGYYDPTDESLHKTPTYLNNLNDLTDSSLEKDPLCFSKLTLWDNIIYKFDIYSKYQDFITQDSNATVEGALPSDQSYKYKAAHIQIRSVSTYEVLQTLVKQLVEDELVWCEGPANKKGLYIIKNNTIINIGASGGSSDDDTMTEQEVNNLILQYLIDNNLIKYTYDESTGNTEPELDDNGNVIFNHPYDAATFWDENADIARDLILNEIASITMVNELGNNYTMYIDASGNVKVELVDNDHTESQLLSDIFSKQQQQGTGSLSYIKKDPDDENKYMLNIYTDDTHTTRNYFIRGFNAIYNVTNDSSVNNLSTFLSTGDILLNSDRVKISAVYAPLASDTIFGCTHGFIELENTSDKDFYLDGTYIYLYKLAGGNPEFHRLKLKGMIPAGGTYLIRCKQYSDASQENTYVDVNSYDIEWYDKEYIQCSATDDNGTIKIESNASKLIDMSMISSGTYALMLLFGSDWNFYGDKDTNDFYYVDNSTSTPTIAYEPFINDVFSDNDAAPQYVAGYIDAVTFGKSFGSWVHSTSGGSSKPQKFAIASNRIYKNMFALDPAKQALNGLYAKDSSRIRLNGAPDLQLLDLANEYITFPKTPDHVKYVTDYTPKASYEHKNVLTDKTQLSDKHPDAVSCFFGVDPNKTRCFNWVSKGIHDEYIWLRKKGTPSWNAPIESYSRSNIKVYDSSATYPQRKEFTSEKLEYVKAFYADPIKNRLSGGLPGNDVQFSAHKVIIDLYSSSYNESVPETWEYIVGRKKQHTNSPDDSFISDVMEFTVYPKDWGTPIIYQTTDQQGFHWQEYQVWTATADKLLQEIQTNHPSNFTNHAYPIIINTGDAVQSGARINEWLDYYDGGKSLFSKYEQLNIVGNNDLSNSADNSAGEWVLGTGNDDGKSNSFFYHIFNCNEIAEGDLEKLVVDTKVACSSSDSTSNTILRCIPSTYYVDFPVHDSNNSSNDYTFRLLMFNTEITSVTCKKWYCQTYNIYTGWPLASAKNISPKDLVYYSGSDFTPIYNTLYQWTADNNKRYILACHEMPFTVMTSDSLNISVENTRKQFRSISGAANKGSLIGSHGNEIDNNIEIYWSGTDGHEFDWPGMHWLSRLLEYRGIHLCIGGHKHTYAVTYPLVENFWWKENGTGDWISSETATYEMGADLSNDKYVSWQYRGESSSSTYDTINTSKLPYTLVDKIYDSNSDTYNNILSAYTQNNNGSYLKVDTGFYEITSNDRYNRSGEGTTESPYEYTQNDEGNYLKVDNNYYEIINSNRYEPSQNKTWRYTSTDKILPGIPKASTPELSKKYVIYFMCQASGYKLKSNKELPSNSQVFSFILPETSNEGDAVTIKPSKEQLYPMTSSIHIKTNKTYDLYLTRYTSIFATDGADKFTQQEFGAASSCKIDQLVKKLYSASDTSINVLKFGTWKKNVTLNNIDNRLFGDQLL